MSTVRTVPRYILPDAHLSPQPINRGPWALRTIRIRCEFHYVSILASFCVWTKSLICKDAVNMNSTVQSEVRRISKFPVSRPDDVSSRPDAHLSTAPSVWTMCHPVRTPDNPASSVRTTCFFRPDTSLYREVSVPACSVRTFQQHVRTPISSRTVH
jgi:hypothetical protein